MLRIRLSRVGKKNKAQFRLTVADAKRSPTGRFIEILGYYNPHSKEKVFKNDRIEYWISRGAKPSATVHNFLVDAGIIKGEKVRSWSPKKKKDETKEETSTAEKKEKDPAPEKKEEAPVPEKKEEVKEAVKEDKK